MPALAISYPAAFKFADKVRPSGTESKIRVMIEAPEEKVAKKFTNDIVNLIKSKI